MTLKVLVAVELHNADDEQITEFEAELASKQWVRFPGEDKNYCTLIEGPATDADVIETAEADVTLSAEVAGIYKWDGVCLLSSPISDSLIQDRWTA